MNLSLTEIIAAVFFFIVGYLFVRNFWVYRLADKAIKRNQYHLFPSYAEMMIKYFWIWSYDEMKKVKK